MGDPLVFLWFDEGINMVFPDGFELGDAGHTAVPEEAAVLGVWLPFLQVPREVLHAAAHTGQAARDFKDPAHPQWYRGVVAPGEATGALRRALMLRGWTIDDTNNIARTIRGDGEVIIMCASGNANTGLRTAPAHAQTRQRRGSAHLAMIERSSQYVIRAMLPAGDPALSDSPIPDISAPAWYFLFYRDGDIVRSELSLAHGVTDDGDLILWAVRLVLPEFDMRGPRSDEGRGSPSVPIIDVPIVRVG